MKSDSIEQMLICITDKYQLVLEIQEFGMATSVLFEEKDADIFIEELTRAVEHLKELKKQAQLEKLTGYPKEIHHA